MNDMHDLEQVLGPKKAKFLKPQFLVNFYSFESTGFTLSHARSYVFTLLHNCVLANSYVFTLKFLYAVL